MMETIHATGTSPGIAIGPVYLQEQQKPEVSVTRIPDEMVEAELAALERALSGVRQEMADLITQTAAKVGAKEAEIFRAQMMLLDDPELIPPVREIIKKEKISAAAAVVRSSGSMSLFLPELKTAYPGPDCRSAYRRRLSGC